MNRKSRSSDIQRGIICRFDDKHHFRFFCSLAEDEGFLKLTPSAQMLLLRMGLASKGRIEFAFPHAAYSKYFSNATFQKAKRQLIEGGFITEMHFTCQENKYRLCNEWQNKKRPPIG